MNEGMDAQVAHGSTRTRSNALVAATVQAPGQGAEIRDACLQLDGLRGGQALDFLQASLCPVHQSLARILQQLAGSESSQLRFTKCPSPFLEGDM